MTDEKSPSESTPGGLGESTIDELYTRQTKVTKPGTTLPDGAQGFCPKCRQVFDEPRSHCPHDSHRLLTIDGSVGERVGETLANRLTLLGLLGAGGMGTVYRAYQHSMKREVAVKLMHPSFSVDPELVNRFMREAKSASRLAHPNIITLFDFGQADDGELYLVMELLTGQTLYDIIRDQAPLAVERALAIADQICDALHAAHGMGIVHRDIKPDNIFIIEGAGALGEFVKVIDFGLARIVDESSMDRATPAGVTAGTPIYMAPEQILGDSSDERTDVYATGLMLYEMLTGTVPFRAKTMAGMVLSQVTQSPPALSTAYADENRPQALDAVVLDALAKRPHDRVASAALLKARLERAMERDSTPKPVLSFEAEPSPMPRRADGTDDSSSFVGRTADLDILAEMIADGRRLITLTGAGGMGKTRLAQRLLADRNPRGEPPTWKGAWFCDLTGTESVDELCHAVARGLQLSLIIGQERSTSVQQLGVALAARGRSLLVLDNFSHIVSLAPITVERWLEAAPQLQIVVTSRETLGLEAETRHDLAPLSLPGPCLAFDHSEAVALFMERAWAARPRWSCSKRDRKAVAEIVRQLDGMPLAIELAAARITILSPAKLLARLEKRLDILTHGVRGPGMRRTTLRAAIESSWELLEGWEQAALAQLAVFAGGFTLDAAEAVVDLEAHSDAPWIGDVVQSLSEKSLLRTTSEPGLDGDVRFSLFESIRQFGADRLAESAAVESCPRQHARFHLEQCGTWVSELQQRLEPELLAKLALEKENLVAIHRRAVESRPPTPQRATEALEAVLCLDPVLVKHGPYATHLALLDDALDYARGLEVPRQLLAQALLAHGEALRARGRIAASVVDYERALALARNAGARVTEGRVLWGLSVAADYDGRLDDARALLEDALGIQRDVGDRIGEGKSVGVRGLSAFWDGHLDEAREQLELAISILHGRDDRYENVILGVLAALNQESGALSEARLQLERCIENLRACGARRHEGMSRGHLAGLEWEQHRLEQASETVNGAIDIVREVGDSRCEALARGLRAAIDATRDRLEAATAGIESARALLLDQPDPLLEVVLELYQGHIDLALARRATAAGNHSEAATRRAAARQRIEAALDGTTGLPVKARSQELRLALRMLEGALDLKQS